MILPVFAAPESAENASSGVVAWISIEPTTGAVGAQGKMLAIAGRAFALRPLQGRYSLKVKRQGRGGVSNSRQGGAISLEPGTPATLSQSAINIGPGDALDIELKLYVDGREVFSVSMRSQASNIKL